MPHGLRTRDASGNILVDISSRLTRLRYSVEVAAADSGSITLDDLTGLSTAEIAIINKASPAWTDAAHLVSRSGNTISWSPDVIAVNSIILVFIYAS